jgi:hypothetical protein
VPDDVANDVRRDAEAEQQSHAGVAEVVEADVQAEPLADRVEVPVQVPWLDRGPPPGGEDQAVFLPLSPRGFALVEARAKSTLRGVSGVPSQPFALDGTVPQHVSALRAALGPWKGAQR